MSARKKLPDPDFSGTDPNAVLRSRIDLNVPINPPSAPTHTQVDTGTDKVRASKGTRQDPPGMRRASFYVSAEAAAALERAADQIVQLLGDGTPRHVALSALLLAGAGQADVVAQELARQRAAELAARLAALPPISE
ncbi:hypothetical protein ACFYTF_30760 [Nocardia thailandica]|uniref:Uncharacterized protein n=1 Tax=Nocardia thailandica TaxID=257275 RepID=A0ABW6PXQ1_9NOCA